MKKTLLSLALLATAATAANAQATFGVKAGVVAATVSGDDTDGVDNRFGGQFGLTANFGINDMFSFQPELLYSQKGFQLKDEDSGLKLESKTTLHYIDVPLMLRLNADGPFFEAGPQVGFLVGRKSETEISGGGNSGSTSETDTDGFSKVDIGYIAGLGYQLESGLSVGIRYNGGINSIFKDDNSSTGGDSKNVRNSAFQFQVGYRFGGK